MSTSYESYESYERPRPGGRHPVSVAHLVSGLVLLGVVVVWALYEAGLVGGDDVRWLLPVPWVLAGGAGLLATTLSARRHREAAAAPAAYGLDDPYADWSPRPDPDPRTDPDTDPTEEIR